MTADASASPVEAIRATLAEYCHTCDDGRFNSFADLFATDAQLVVMGRTHTGREAIGAFMAAAQPPDRRGKHLCANSLITVSADGRHARAVTDYVFVGRAESGDGAAGGPMGSFAITSVGRYHDELVREGDRWRFARREIVFLGDERDG